MMTKLDRLVAHLGDLGVSVEWCHFENPLRRGVYLDDERVVRLGHHLTVAQATATCAHEVGHAEFRDRCSSPKAERRAWEYGAALVIEPLEYAMAERMVGESPAALATELCVTPKLILAWRDWFERCYPLEQQRWLLLDDEVETIIAEDFAYD